MLAKQQNRKRREPPSETPEQLRARLRLFVQRTRGQATRPSSIAFPEHVTVLAGPLRRRSPAR
jgi:hypothetical protein